MPATPFDPRRPDEQHILFVPAPPAYPPFVPPPRPSYRSYPPKPQHPPAAPRSELARLRTAYRRLRRGMTWTALGYFAVFLCLAGFAPSVMGDSVSGTLNTGVLLGLLQIPVTILAVTGYERAARRSIDPVAHRVRLTDAEARQSRRATG